MVLPTGLWLLGYWVMLAAVASTPYLPDGSSSFPSGVGCGLLLLAPAVAILLTGINEPETWVKRPYLLLMYAYAVGPAGIALVALGVRVVLGSRSAWVLGVTVGLGLLVLALVALELLVRRRWSSTSSAPKRVLLLLWLVAIGLQVLGIKAYWDACPARPERPAQTPVAPITAPESELAVNLAAVPGEGWPGLEAGVGDGLAPIRSGVVVETRVREDESRFGPRWKQGWDPDYVDEYVPLQSSSASYRVLRVGKHEELGAALVVTRTSDYVWHRWTLNTDPPRTTALKLFSGGRTLFARRGSETVYQLPNTMELDQAWKVGESTFRWGPLVDITVDGVTYPRCWKLLIEGGPVRRAVHYYARDLGLVAQRTEFHSGEAQWVLLDAPDSEPKQRH